MFGTDLDQIGGLGTQAPAQVNDVELQGDGAHQTPGPFLVQPPGGHLEELFHGLFMGEAGDVMIGAAAIGAEVGGPGVQEIEGGDVLQDPLQHLVGPGLADGVIAAPGRP